MAQVAPLLPWTVIIDPDFYDDPCDAGYAWSGKATDEADAIRQALATCWSDNGLGEDPPGYDPDAHLQDGFKVVDTDIDFRELAAAVIRARRSALAEPGSHVGRLSEALDDLDAGFRASGRDA